MVKKCRGINCLLQGLCRHFRVAARCWGPKQVFVICLHFDSLIDILTNATSSSGPLFHGTFYENL
jgi:hypothetical protein